MQKGQITKVLQNNYEREYCHTFQVHGNKKKYKESYKDKYRDENSMIVIDLVIWIILMVEIGHIVEIGLKTTVEMSIRKIIINIRKGLEIIMIQNESYNSGRDRSREKQCECNARKTPYFSKLELVDNTI